MMTSSASPIASKRLTTERRALGADRAEREREQQREDTSGSTSPLRRGGEHIVGDHALEEIGDARKRRGALLLYAAAAPPCSALAVAPRATGTPWSETAIMTAPKIDETVQMMTIHSTERPAIRPPSAASRLFAMPTTSNATTSGMTVIFSALSHKVPTKPATPSAVALAAGGQSVRRPRRGRGQ